MKCKQKLCNRNKNICPNGNCNVCEDAIKEVQKVQQKECKKPNLEELQVDLASMVKMHEKLIKGERVDPTEVSSLLLAGIIKILYQHDSIDFLEQKMNDVETENATNRFRIESLETWVTKQADSIHKLELEIKEIKKTETNESGPTVQEEPKSKIKCRECGEIFSKTAILKNI